MFYDLGCLRIPILTFRRNIEISFLVRLSKETLISSKTGTLCACEVKENQKLFKFQIISHFGN